MSVENADVTLKVCLSQQSSSPMSQDSPLSSVKEFTKDCQENLSLNVLTESGLRAIEEIPMPYRHIFSAYPSFNAFQSKVMDDILYSDQPVVVSAPTGSGKTVLFELAIVNLLIKLQELNCNESFIIIYMAPIKALCSERVKDWQQKFSSLGLVCQEVTGDSEHTTMAEISKFNIVLTTPEKWDSLTRTWKNNIRVVQMIKLFLLDEIHLLNDEQRGPVLEAVVSRMKTIQETSTLSEWQDREVKISPLSFSIRFLAISATVPNIEDVASWLGKINCPAKYFSLGEEYRPVPLRKLVVGYHYSQGFSQFRFDMQLSYKLRQLLLQYSEGKPSLIFCSTRKSVIMTADILIRQLTFHFNEEQKRKLSKSIDEIKENVIKKYLSAGVGCHHAGMNINDRHTIEDLFRSGGLPVLVTTSTLAMGVNLPAHLVIIKSTQQYVGRGYQEYSSNQILQMIGRAGRPQYDTHATAVIMTQEDKVIKYEKLMMGTDILESNLHRHLVEHLNSEIVLSTITEKAVALNWIRSTFLYVRVLNNPSHYGISPNFSRKTIEDKLQEMCMIEMNALANAELMKMSEHKVWPTETGKLMAYYYLSFETMKAFRKINGKEKIPDILNIIANCHEFGDCILRVNEKKTLNYLNKSIRFPIKGLIKTSQMKVNCLIQVMFGGLMVQEPSLQQEAIRIVRTGIRVSKCLARYLALHNKFQSLLSATILSKCFQSNLWEDSPFVSRQLAGIGAVLSQLLVSSGKSSFKSIAESNPRDLERIINRAPPMGNRLRDAALHIPQYELIVTQDASMSLIQINISVKISNYTVIKETSTLGFNHNLVIIAGDSENMLLLHNKFQDILLLNNEGSYTWVIEVTKKTVQIFIRLISEEWVGMDVKTSVIPRTLAPMMAAKNQTSGLNQCKTSSPKHLDRKNIGMNDNEYKRNDSPLHQLHKTSMNFNKVSKRKKLPLKPEIKGIQSNLEKYLFKPQEKPKLYSTSNTDSTLFACPQVQDFIQYSAAYGEKRGIQEDKNLNAEKNVKSKCSFSLQLLQLDNTSVTGKNKNKVVPSKISNCDEKQNSSSPTLCFSLNSTSTTNVAISTFKKGGQEKRALEEVPCHLEENSALPSQGAEPHFKIVKYNNPVIPGMKSEIQKHSKQIMETCNDEEVIPLNVATQSHTKPSPLLPEPKQKNTIKEHNIFLETNIEFHKSTEPKTYGITPQEGNSSSENVNDDTSMNTANEVEAEHSEVLNYSEKANSFSPTRFFLNLTSTPDIVPSTFKTVGEKKEGAHDELPNYLQETATLYPLLGDRSPLKTRMYNNFVSPVVSEIEKHSKNITQTYNNEEWTQLNVSTQSHRKLSPKLQESNLKNTIIKDNLFVEIDKKFHHTTQMRTHEITQQEINNLPENVDDLTSPKTQANLKIPFLKDWSMFSNVPSGSQSILNPNHADQKSEKQENNCFEIHVKFSQSLKSLKLGNFDLGIEKLLENEESELNSENQSFNTPKCKINIQQKQLDFKNPVTKLLYGIYKTENTLKDDVNPTLPAHISPETREDKGFWTLNNYSQDDTEGNFLGSQWDITRFLDPRNNNAFQDECTLDGLKYIQNSNEHVDEGLIHKQIIYSENQYSFKNSENSLNFF